MAAETNETSSESCEHLRQTLARTEGFGGWQPAEIYTCDACDASIRREIDIWGDDE